MAAFATHRNPLPLINCFRSPSPNPTHLQNPNFVIPTSSNHLFFKEVEQKVRVLNLKYKNRDGKYSITCSCQKGSGNGLDSAEEESEEIERPPFDINLAVLLAGFAFEAYSSPPENVGRREVDAADCQTIYLSETFLREVYDGQLFIKLKNGVNFPAMDPWGTSDPYVVMQLDGQIVKSKVKWATKEPTWNEDFTLNIKLPPTNDLQIAAWDANLVTPHKRMGNAAISLESLCDGCLHKAVVELVGMGGGGKIHVEIKYKSYDGADEEKEWWRIPFISDLIKQNNFGPALEKVLGTDTVQARQFVQYAFGKLRSFDYSDQKNSLPEGDINDMEGSANLKRLDGNSNICLQQENDQGSSTGNSSLKEVGNVPANCTQNSDKGGETGMEAPVVESLQSDNFFWNNFADVLNRTVVQKLDISVPGQLRWDGFDLLNSIGLQSKRIAEAGYVESGLAAPDSKGGNDMTSDTSSIVRGTQMPLPDIKKVSSNLLRQTDTILGALMVLTTSSQKNKDSHSVGESDAANDSSVGILDDDAPGCSSGDKILSPLDESSLDQRQTEEMKELFSTAESAMEAWAMLATSLGHPSFIKSEFEKICFLDNETTDTQVAVWRDLQGRRLVVAFRGTEQARWKDLRTDLMIAPTGLNPERIGGDFKQEIQVHSGFLSAYDSVRTKLISLIKLSIGFTGDSVEVFPKWHVYVTGHSLGGALATLLALELSSSLMAKHGAFSLTMYNFGSPRVGNRRFVEVYNKKVKDSWRIVNHRDIIPTVPRLMGYCHVAQPIYLASGSLTDALANAELLADGYHADVIAEYTPDVLVTEFMKGERELIEKILQTEINIFRSVRDGSALMQHMEDFYYITLLENVRSNYRSGGSSSSNEPST